jgi:hypothetical protein
MIIIRRRKQRDQSSTTSPISSHKLFAGYPYPIIDELNEKQEKLSDHSLALISLQWYKDSFHKMFSISRGHHSHSSSTSITEQSFRQAYIDEHSSKAIVNNLQKETKPIRIQRVLATSISSPINEQKKQNNKRHVQKTNLKSINHKTDDD